MEVSESYKFTATLMPIKSVGVQGDCRSYSYVVGLSEEVAVAADGDDMNGDQDAADRQKFESLIKLAKLIPRVCHNVNRVCYVFGSPVRQPGWWPSFSLFSKSK